MNPATTQTPTIATTTTPGRIALRTSVRPAGPNVRVPDVPKVRIPTVLDLELALETFLLALDDTTDSLDPQPHELFVTVAEDERWTVTATRPDELLGVGRLHRRYSHATGEDRYPVVSAVVSAVGVHARAVLVEDSGEVIPIPAGPHDPEVAALAD